MSRINLAPKRILIGSLIEKINQKKIEGSLESCKFRIGYAVVRYSITYKLNILYCGLFRISWRLLK